MSWYVMRDLKRPNALRPAWVELRDLGLRIFTPMTTKVVRHRGKTERAERPYLPDLLFVESDRATLDPIVATIPTLQYRYIRGAGQASPMTVRDADMQRFIAAIESSEGDVRYYSPGEITPSMYGRDVRIHGGPLDGLTARLLSLRGLRKKRLIVDLPGILTATVEVNPDLIELL